jgi:hypothetical protein
LHDQEAFSGITDLLLPHLCWLKSRDRQGRTSTTNSATTLLGVILGTIGNLLGMLILVAMLTGAGASTKLLISQV